MRRAFSTGRGPRQLSPKDAHDQRRVLLQLTPTSEHHRELFLAAWASLLAGLLPAMTQRDAELLIAAGPALARLAELAAAGQPY